MKKVICSVLLVFILGFTASESLAQCAMCRRVAETNRDSNENKIGNHLNYGILYLLSIPYIIGVIGTIVWMKNRKKD